MKFSEKQIEKVSALRTELVEKVNAFEHGVLYGRRIFLPEGDSVIPTWISDLVDKIDSLMIEEMKIGDTDISEFDEADFYVSLGEYFEKINSIVRDIDEKILPYFYSIIGVYKKYIMKALKK